MLDSIIEVNTDICNDVSEVRDDLGKKITLPQLDEVLKSNFNLLPSE